MLRKTAEALQGRLLAAFPASRSYRQTILDDPAMPPLIGHFLKRVLSGRIGRIDVQVQPEWFDYAAPHMAEAEAAWRDALEEAARIPAAAWQRTLEQGIRLVLLHLIQPVSTLTTFVYGQEDEVLALDVIAGRMGYFLAYPHLSNTIEALSLGEQMDLDRQTFEQILHRADRTHTEGFDPEAWADHLAPLFDLVGQAGLKRMTGVPTALLRIFFEHKDHPEIVQRLQFEEEVRGTTGVDPEGLKQILEVVLRMQVPEEEEHTPAAAAEPEPEAAADEEPVAAVPRWMQFQQQEAAETDDPEPFAEAEEAEPEVAPMAEVEADEPEPEEAPEEEPVAEVEAEEVEEEPVGDAEVEEAEEEWPEEELVAEEAAAEEEEGDEEEVVPAESEPVAEAEVEETAPIEEAEPEEAPDEEPVAEAEVEETEEAWPEEEPVARWVEAEVEDAPDLLPPRGRIGRRAPLPSDLLQAEKRTRALPASQESTSDPEAATADRPRGSRIIPLFGDEPAPGEAPVAQQDAPEAAVEVAPADPPEEADATNHPVADAPKAAPAPDDPPEVEELPEAEDLPKAEERSEADADDDKPIPLWMQYQQKQGTATPRAVAPLQTRTAVSPELEELERYVIGAAGASRRAWFVRQLFKGSYEAYEGVLRQLAASGTWREASQVIAADVFRKYNINIYSEPAVAFTDAVEMRFHE